MAQLFRKLGWLDMVIMVLGVGVLVYLQVTKDAEIERTEIEIAVYPDTTEIILTGEIPSAGSVRAAYDEWAADLSYFGAFAVGADESYGWSTRYGSPESARIGALAFCENRSSDCQVIATTLPVDFVPTEAETLEADAANGLLAYESKEGAKAYAHSPLGIAHWSWGYTTVQEAERVAFNKCDERVRAYGEGKPIPYWPCRVLRSEP